MVSSLHIFQIKSCIKGNVYPKPAITAQRAGIAQAVQLLVKGWAVRESNPGGGEIFRTRPYLPWTNQPPTQWVPGHSRGKAGGAWP